MTNIAEKEKSLDYNVEDELDELARYIQDFHSEYMLNINELKSSVSTQHHDFLCALYILTLRPDICKKISNEPPF